MTSEREQLREKYLKMLSETPRYKNLSIKEKQEIIDSLFNLFEIIYLCAANKAAQNL